MDKEVVLIETGTDSKRWVILGSFETNYLTSLNINLLFCKMMITIHCSIEIFQESHLCDLIDVKCYWWWWCDIIGKRPYGAHLCILPLYLVYSWFLIIFD